jgi:hypothetical protein
MATIRKNTKAHAEAISSAKAITCYSLNNDFLGKQVESIPAFVVETGKLKTDGGKYTLTLHSNLWYEFV